MVQESFIMSSMAIVLGLLCLGAIAAVAILGVIAIALRKSGHAQVPCPGCGRKIAQFTENCPHCGRQLLPPT